MAETLFGTDELSLYTMSLIAGAVIVCLALVYWFLRRRGHMAFMRGGANRQPRLAVLDAAAVDARRRLVLVRRDDVEHLILIGGPSDLVVESGIGRATAVAQPEKAKAPAARAPARSSKPATAAQPARQPAKPNGEPQREAAQTPPRTEARPEPAKPVRAEPVAAPRPSAEPVAEPKRPPEPVAVRPAVSTAAAAAAVVPNGNVRTEAKPERDLASAGATAEKPATEPSKENRENTPQEAAQTAAPEKPPVEPAEKPAPAKPSSDSDAIKTEFEDALDAARELVMPATTPASEAPPAPEPDMNYAHAVPQPPKANAAPSPASAPQPAEPEKATVEPVKPDAPQQQNMTAEDLIADFDRVLEAEMSKSEADQLPPTAAKKPQTEETPEAGASLEDEMKKLLGDLSAKQ